MKRYRAVLFDMDGTLLKSDEGIINSIKYALKKMGKPELDREKLRAFIGPPIVTRLTEHHGFTESEAQIAVRYYRERYSAVGIFESDLYPGIREMLDTLKKKGFLIAVASAKPEPFILRTLKQYALTEYFDEAVGSDMHGAPVRKADIIEETLKRLEMEDKRDCAVMVGDRKYDVRGAIQAGIDCVAVTYGFGSAEELREAGAEKTAGSVSELTEILCSF